MKKPFVTVAVCSMNRAHLLKNLLDSLMKLSYPKDRHEIIVVNDGSSDGTAELLEKYPIRAIHHKTNKGIPTARNTLLNNAKGEIIAYTDDDCVVEHDWLTRLVDALEDPEVMGVAGLIAARKTGTIMENYMFETGYGNPVPREFGLSKNPLYRFYIYYKSMFSPMHRSKTKRVVQCIHTANAAYRTELVRGIGGFDERLLTSEDTDVSNRLYEAHPDMKLIFEPRAVLSHVHRTSLPELMREGFVRSQNTMALYMKEKKIPPIFPFPLGILSFSFIGLLFNPVIGLALLLILPQVFYAWWPHRFLTSGKLSFLLFAYVQPLIEFSSTCGLVRGVFRRRE